MSLNFIAFGDWGFVGHNQTRVAAQVAAYAGAVNASFVVALGDNFYEDGVQNDTDSLWTKAYVNVYSQESLQIPWYAVLGNHDFYGKPEAQIDYYNNKRDNRWNLPQHFYSKIWDIPETANTLEIIFIDTTMLAPEVIQETRKGGEYEVTADEVDNLYVLLENHLRESRSTWLIVAGHYTVFSVNGHGDYPSLVSRLSPLLLQYGVHFYICGHDHAMHHIQWSNMHYFLSGAGGAPLQQYNPNTPTKTSAAEKGLIFYDESFGFSGISANKTTLIVKMISVDGYVLHQYDFTNPREFNFNGEVTDFLIPTIVLSLLGCCLLFICIWKLSKSSEVSEPIKDWKDRVLDKAWEVSANNTRGVFEVLSESDDEDGMVEISLMDSADADTSAIRKV